ncbi:NAD(P)/FAD-dependent oxidoreductase [Leptospira sp. WS39.C2]
MSFVKTTVQVTNKGEEIKWDTEVLIIGAGPAGLGAAMSLGRLRRTALVCDDFRPRNLKAAHMHNFPSYEGLSPLEWRKKARKDIERYDTIHFYEGAVNSVVKIQGGFEATLSNQSSLKVKKVILAYGVEDRLPPIPGMQELWGKSVFHCPFCHAYEHRGERIGVFAKGAAIMRFIPMIYGVASEVTLFTNGKSELTAEQIEIFQRKNVRIIELPVEKMIHDGDSLRAVIAGGERFELEAILGGGPMPFKMKSDVGESLGCDKDEKGLYKVDEANRTSVPGVYAGGDSMSMQHSVVGALSTGQWAGATAALDLLSEAFSA